MTTQHTPGPWSIQGDGILLHPVTKAQLLTTRIETYLGTFEILDETNEPQANARLIAAAPELLEALKIAMHYMEGDSDDEREGMDYATIEEAIAKASNNPTTN